MDTNTNDNGYTLHLEVFVMLLAMSLLGFGMYNIAFGQVNPTDKVTGIGGTVNVNGTGKKKNPDVPGAYGVDLYPNLQVNSVTATTTTSTSPWVNYIPNPWVPVATTGTNNGTNTGGTNSNNGGYYGSGGIYDPNVVKTQGGYNNATNGSYYGSNGFIDQTGVQTRGGYILNKEGGVYGQGGNYENGAFQTQGNYIYNKEGGSYGQGGVYEGGAFQTQGYVAGGKGQAIYGSNGINDNLATPTVGVKIPASTISAPTSTNSINFKNCSAFTKYHSFGDRGGDVGAIQMFLKEKGYYSGKVDGVYGITTFKAVQDFQKDYSDQILNPWEIKNQKATGVWYKSTRKKANQLMGCPEPAVYLERVNKILEY